MKLEQPSESHTSLTLILVEPSLPSRSLAERPLLLQGPGLQLRTDADLTALAEATWWGRVECQTLADPAAWLPAVCESWGLRRQALSHPRRQPEPPSWWGRRPDRCTTRALHHGQLRLAEGSLLQSQANPVNSPCLDFLACNTGTVIVQVQRVGECIRDVTCVQIACPN